MSQHAGNAHRRAVARAVDNSVDAFPRIFLWSSATPACLIRHFFIYFSSRYITNLKHADELTPNLPQMAPAINVNNSSPVCPNFRPF